MSLITRPNPQLGWGVTIGRETRPLQFPSFTSKSTHRQSFAVGSKLVAILPLMRHRNKLSRRTLSYFTGAPPMYVLPKLPYAYDALEPVMSDRTLRFHHDKHHAG